MPCLSSLAGLWFHEFHNHVIKRIELANSTVQLMIGSPQRDDPGTADGAALSEATLSFVRDLAFTPDYSEL
jgi:hypothetical protein